MILSREQILNPVRYPFVDVEVPDWGGTVRVRDMGAAARDRILQFFLDRNAAEAQVANAWAYKVLVCALTICDDSGKLLFSEADVQALSELSATALDLVYAAAADLNLLTPKAQEAAAKNSDSPSEPSGSDSPGTLDAASPNCSPV